MVGISSTIGVPQPKAFQRAMIFVDGTNMFYRLRSNKLQVNNIARLISSYIGERQLVRSYLYTIKEKYDEAKLIHGENFCENIRVVFGDGIATGDGNIKEKGVDALLVADLIYHAASKNFNYALVVSHDTDFAHAVKRVEDFGCRTGVLGVCGEVPERLKNICDEVFSITKDMIIRNNFGCQIQ